MITEGAGMRTKIIPIFILSMFLAASLILQGCQASPAGKIEITEIKMSMAIDEKLMPVNPIDMFPKGTPKVYCWFNWRNAKVSAHITAKWHYTSEDVDILSYQFSIPRRDGAGSVSLYAGR